MNTFFHAFGIAHYGLLFRIMIRYAQLDRRYKKSMRLIDWVPLLLGVYGALASEAEAPQFSRDVLPILSDLCFHCHGPDKETRKAGLRLDVRENALQDLGGYFAIVPGNPAKSVLLDRIVSHDSDEVMPPPKSGKKITPNQISILRRWIAAGATYEKHWAFVPPVRPTVPSVKGALAEWARNPIDSFVAARLHREGLTPAPEAPAHTLARRVSFDLTGLPPLPADVAAFTKAFADPQKRELAWTEFVRGRLKSPHYGERMAQFWLDAARYSDTDGFQADETRSNWPWRDWVVAAFNQNMPYDQFTIEQFAGDLLPNATLEQKLATTFHRNHMTNGEGGRDPEESRIDYVIDRVNTTGTLWLGLTLGCTQCHDHKYDPISQADFYSLNAFFNSIDEDGKAGKSAKPYLAVKSPFGARAVSDAQKFLAKRKEEENQARRLAEPAFEKWLEDTIVSVREDFQAWKIFKPTTLESSDGTEFSIEKDGAVQTLGPNPEQDDYRAIGSVSLRRVTGFKLEVLPHTSHANGGLARSNDGHFVLTDVKAQVRTRGNSQIREIQIASAIADYSADPKKNKGYGDIKHTLDDDPRNGWASFDSDVKRPHVAVFGLAEPEVLGPDEELIIELRHRALGGRMNVGRFRISLTDQAGVAVRKLGAAPLEQLAEAKVKSSAAIAAPLRKLLFEQFLADYEPFAPYRKASDRSQSHLNEMKKAADSLNVMVLAERVSPRQTHVLVRGEWDKKGAVVERNVPASIAPWPEKEEKTRLGLARWLLHRNNPLTARVTVNHIWQLMFGNGLVGTPEDFGVQGERPEYPELLDWLAVEFIESKWNLQHIIELIASSATYRQSSIANDVLLQRDPHNRMLARGARFRLPSWMIRDGALQSSGLLNPLLGGPPVFPYQPEGVWEDITMGRFKYSVSEGPDQYRRSLYAFWRRSSAPTFMFDSAQRRVCEVRTLRTNTPLHALMLLNDETYLEAARVLSEKALSVGKEFKGRASDIFQRVLSRDPTSNEVALLEKGYVKALAHYSAHPKDAEKLLSVGQSSSPSKSLPELAALMLTASQILNMDEAITRE